MVHLFDALGKQMQRGISLEPLWISSEYLAFNMKEFPIYWGLNAIQAYIGSIKNLLDRDPKSWKLMILLIFLQICMVR